jgi:uncharacterized protein YeaO (DUF488 family)
MQAVLGRLRDGHLVGVKKEHAVGTHISYRRIYDQPARSDGVRVLVDRVWPRGVRKEEAHLDEWLREVAPSTGLRRWYGHTPERFAEFRCRYLAELQDPRHREAAEHLRSLARKQDVTLLTATRDVERSQAAVLAQWLDDASHQSS